MLHRPTDRAQPRALVMCPPFGEERKSAARVMTLAARALARQGHFVLRFDYSGTGESDGGIELASIGRWLDDIVDARSHLAARSGVRSVGLLGIRFGATLAALLPTREAPLPLLILWGPLMSGTGCLEESRRHIEATRLVTADTEGVRLEAHSAPPDGWDMGGFRLSEPFGRELQQICLNQNVRARADRVGVVGFSGRRSVSTDHVRLAERLVTPSGKARCLTYPARPFWVTASRYDPTDLVAQTLEAVEGDTAQSGHHKRQVRS
jgi:pimeloyl-ACP methyl ester carboxylesterase